MVRTCGDTPLGLRLQIKGWGYSQCLQREKFSLKRVLVLGFFFHHSPFYRQEIIGMQPFGEDWLKQSISLTKHLVTPLCSLGMVTSIVLNKMCWAEQGCVWDPGSPGISSEPQDLWDCCLKEQGQEQGASPCFGVAVAFSSGCVKQVF